MQNSYLMKCPKTRCPCKLMCLNVYAKNMLPRIFGDRCMLDLCQRASLKEVSARAML